MSTLKRQINSSSNFSSFFSIITYNSSVNIYLMHFLRLDKRVPWMYQSLHLHVFWWKLPNSSCHFQILPDSSVSLKTTPRYFFKYFFKVQILETFECSDQNPPNSCHVWNNTSVFLQILLHSSVWWDITSLYFFSSWNFIYFHQKEQMKVQIWLNFTCAVENLKCCTLMGSFCKNHIKF